MAVAVEARQVPTMTVRFRILREVVRRPAGAIALTIIALVILLAIFAPLIAPRNPDSIDVVNRLTGPSSSHLLGADYLGRDSLSRVIYGTRLALGIALPAVAISFVIGLALGLISGYFAGFLDKTMTVIFDTVLAFPGVILALALLTVLGQSVGNTIILIAVAFTPWYARLARAQTLAAKQNPYVKAERSLGARRTRILAGHILPNVIPALLILVAMDIPSAIGFEAGLAFLGLGVQPPTPDWGVMLQDGFNYVRISPWPIVGPLVMLLVVTAAFTMLGETLRDITDPKFVVSRRRQAARGLRRL
jgi:peptide/nickel transport system permease protein